MTQASRSALDPDELAALEDQREFLLRSLEDLEREHDAGDLDDVDYETLRDDYTARAAEVLRAIDARRAALADARRPRDLKRTLLVLGGVSAFAVLAGVLVAMSLGARGEGDTISGGISTSQTPNQRAQECQQLMNPSAPSEALDCFAEVLEDDPRNVVARTWSAWQLELTTNFLPEDGDELPAVQERAEALLDEAIELNPSYSYARALRAIVAYRHGDAEAARHHLDEFLANDPSADAKAIIEQYDLEAAIDEALAATGATTTTSSPTSTTDPSTTDPG